MKKPNSYRVVMLIPQDYGVIMLTVYLGSYWRLVDHIAANMCESHWTRPAWKLHDYYGTVIIAAHKHSATAAAAAARKDYW